MKDNLGELLRSEAFQWLRKAAGCPVLLLSTSFDFVVTPVADYLTEHFGILIIAKGTGYRLDDGILQEADGVLDGEQKQDFLIDYVNKKGLSQSHIRVYSDSIRDLPLLEVATVPVVVSPDRRLRAVAKKRSWTIIEA